MKGTKLFIAIGALVAILGQFWGSNYYLPLIGGAITLVSVAMD